MRARAQAMSAPAIAALAARGFDPVFGGRPVKRVIQRELETPLARALLSAQFQVRGCGRLCVVVGGCGWLCVVVRHGKACSGSQHGGA